MAVRTQGSIKILQLGRSRFMVATELPSTNPLDWLLFGVAIAGANGVATEFLSPVAVRLDTAGRPQAVLFRGASADLYDDNDPPEAGAWHLRAGNPQTIVMGSVPQVGEYLAFLWAVTE
jgi:hypothetical protein